MIMLTTIFALSYSGLLQSTDTDPEAYVPIVYDKHYSENDAVCGSLQNSINSQLENSRIVNYAELDNFIQWEVIVPKIPKVTGDDLLWAATADLNGDGQEEALIKYLTYMPLISFGLVAYSQPPMKILSSFDQGQVTYYQYLKIFSEASNTEITNNNAPLYRVHFHRSFPLTKLPGNTDTPSKRTRFNAIASDFYLYQHGKKYYLAVDPRYYEPNGDSEIRSVPWYVLFHVNLDGSLSEYCILKRQS
ncbi:MAG: hypothetical protein GY829_02805 [Gammaproteobacteria bacterium]|nr:hypothetical protein [Gammaproteobacteria bacterium]